MKFLYKSVMFLTLLLFCVGSVCATNPDNTTSNSVTDSVNDYNTIRASVDRLEANDVTQTNMINELNTTVNNQAIKINELNTTVNDLKEDNKALREDNKALREDNEALNSKIDNQSVIINELNTTVNNQAIKINELNTTVNNQSVIINNLKSNNEALNSKIDNQSVIINNLKSNNEALNSKIDNLKLENENFKNKRIEILENLTYANVKLRELELNNNTQVAEIQKLKDTIKNLTNENNRLKAINNDLKAKQVSYADVHNAIKTVNNYVKKHKKAPDTVKCGGKSFKLNDFLNLQLVKDGKKRALLFKGKTGNLPNYVIVASYQLDLNIYKKLYNL